MVNKEHIKQCQNNIGNKKDLKEAHFAHDGLLPTAVDHVGDEEMTVDYAMADEKVRNDHLSMLVKASDDLLKKLNAHLEAQTMNFDDLTQS